MGSGSGCGRGWVFVVLMVWCGSVVASESVPGGGLGRPPTPAETREAERLAREHFGDSVVEGAKALRPGADRNLAERAARGERITLAVSELTGVAINPLCGITALGMYRYFTTDVALRDRLSFYDQPYVWGVLLAIILLMAFNSTICEAIPLVKVPLNALGDLVNKGGAALVLPVALYEFAHNFAPTAADGWLAAASWASPMAFAAEGAASAGDGIWIALGWVTALTLGLGSYAAVWVVWNVVDVMILISPFPFLDAMLKSVRLGAMGLVAGSAAVNDGFGLVVALAMVLLCWCLAGWAFRWSVLGFVFAWDFLLWRKASPPDAATGVPAFAAAAAGRWKVPPRRYGRLQRAPDGTLRFSWRVLLVGPGREVALGRSGDFNGGSTLLYPAVLGEDGSRILFRLPPRYRSVPQAVANALGLREWRDISVFRSFRRGGGERAEFVVRTAPASEE